MVAKSVGNLVVWMDELLVVNLELSMAVKWAAWKALPQVAS